MKAIETIYNGYRFRSRLEAKWAVFFDAAGIKYEYEPEGFDLDGTYYLPDFFLPWFNMYVEIKPDSIDDIALDEAERKLELLFNGLDNVICGLFCGDPAKNIMKVMCVDVTTSGGGYSWNNAKFLQGAEFGDHCFTKHTISLAIGETRDRSDREYLDSSYDTIGYMHPLHTVTGFRSELDECKMMARQARFEHGETPRIK